MKKLGVFILLTLFLVAGFVSAQPSLTGFAEGARNFYNNIFEPFGKFLLGQNTDNGELFFAKLLLFVLLTSFVWYVVEKFPQIKGRNAFIISVIFAILAVRFITPEWVNTIILSYGTVGIAVSCLIPFVFFFFLVETGLAGKTVLRKVCWIFLAVVFLGLFFYKGLSIVPAPDKDFNPGYVYLIATGASILMLFIDGTIQSAFARARASNAKDFRKAKLETELNIEYDNAWNSFTANAARKVGSNTAIAHIRTRARSAGIPEANYPDIP